MSEITDLVLPILQRLHSDVADLKRDFASVKSVQAEHGAKLEDLLIHLAYLTSNLEQV